MNLEAELKLKKVVLSGDIDCQLVLLFLINRYLYDDEFIVRIRNAIEYLTKVLIEEKEWIKEESTSKF